MKISKMTTILLFLLFPLAVTAQEPPLEEVVRALEVPFSGAVPQQAIRDFRAEFQQSSQLVALDRVQKGHGRVVVRFPAAGARSEALPMFRWQYEKPEPQEIISDGKVLWVYLPDNRQVIRSELDQTLAARGEDPLLFLTGLGNLAQNFTIAWAEPRRDPQGNFVLELIPRRPSPYIERLWITVPREAVSAGGQKSPIVFPLRATTVFDPAGNITRIEFLQVAINQKPAAKEFSFTPPPGVEVLSPAGRELGF